MHALQSEETFFQFRDSSPECGVIRLHRDWSKRGLPLLKFRLGIHTGNCLVGNFAQASGIPRTDCSPEALPPTPTWRVFGTALQLFFFCIETPLKFDLVVDFFNVIFILTTPSRGFFKLEVIQPPGGPTHTPPEVCRIEVSTQKKVSAQNGEIFFPSK